MGSRRSETGDRAGRYRFSGRFIGWTTTVLMVSMIGMVAAGFIVGFYSDSVEGESGDILGMVAVALIIGGLTLPLLIAAVLGGEAIRKGAGAIGFFLMVGMFATVAGSTELGRKLLGPDWTPWAVPGGTALMIIAVVSFWIVGWIAKVPMWIQDPILGSPRLYVRPGRPTRHRPGE